MALGTKILSSILARDALITDYDLWRAQHRVEDELFHCRRLSKPVPIDLVYARRIIGSAWAKRNGHPK